MEMRRLSSLVSVCLFVCFVFLGRSLFLFCFIFDKEEKSLINLLTAVSYSQLSVLWSFQPDTNTFSRTEDEIEIKNIAGIYIYTFLLA